MIVIFHHSNIYKVFLVTPLEDNMYSKSANISYVLKKVMLVIIYATLDTHFISYLDSLSFNLGVTYMLFWFHNFYCMSFFCVMFVVLVIKENL